MVSMDSEDQELETQLNAIVTDLVALKTAVDTHKTAVVELIDDHATFKTAVDELNTLTDELHDDHATLKTLTDELHVDVDLNGAALEAILTKMDSDSGINDTDYVAVHGRSGSGSSIQAAAVAASDVATLTATKATAGPATLTASDPTAVGSLTSTAGT